MPALFTRALYEQLPEGFPAQLVEGSLVRDLAPTYGHQRIASRLHVRLAALVGADRALTAPADVVLDEFNVYQPDLLVLDEAPESGSHDVGIPLLVVEVLSPSTHVRDRGVKRERLLGAGEEKAQGQIGRTVTRLVVLLIAAWLCVGAGGCRTACCPPSQLRSPKQVAVRVLEPLPASPRDDTILLLAASGEAILTLVRDPLDPSQYRFGTAIYKGAWQEREGSLTINLTWEERWGEDGGPDREIEAALALSPSRRIVFRPLGGDRFRLMRFDVEAGMSEEWRLASTYSVPVKYLVRELERPPPRPHRER